MTGVCYLSHLNEQLPWQEGFTCQHDNCGSVRAQIPCYFPLEGNWYLINRLLSMKSTHIYWESWAIKKAECRRIDAFKLWCWRRLLRVPWTAWSFPGGSCGKEPTCNVGDWSSIPGLGKCPGEGHGTPLQYSGLQNSMNSIVHEVAKSWTQQSDFHFHWTARSSQSVEKEINTEYSLEGLML